MGRSLSSHIVTPLQVHIFLGFSNRPAERAMIPQATLKKGVIGIVLGVFLQQIAPKLVLQVICLWHRILAFFFF